MSFWRKRKMEEAPISLGYDICLLSDIGCVRSVNQDSGRFVDPTDSKVRATKGTMVVVADGVGGHQAGEVASKLAVDAITQSYYSDAGEPNASLVKACKLANREIHERASQDEALNGMGTTCVILALINGQARACHVGDSRLYLIRDDHAYLMTQDDSAVMELVKQGILTLGEARHHAEKNIILRALGTHPEVDVTVWEEPLPIRPNDTFLLCSDGLTDMVEDDEIQQLVASGEVQNACRNLVDLAKKRGGPDNITVALVRVKSQEAGEPRATREAHALEPEA